MLCDIVLRTVPKLRGPHLILEFGCSSGALTQRLLHFVDVARTLSTDVTVYAFDTFEGLPAGDTKLDYSLSSVGRSGTYWARGSFASDIETVERRLKKFGFRTFVS